MVTLMNEGHPRSEVTQYSWPTIELCLEGLAQKYGAAETERGGRRRRPGKKRRAPDLEVVPMPRHEYYRRMGVTDPKALGLE